jgi:hypothetical protein
LIIRRPAAPGNLHETQVWEAGSTSDVPESRLRGSATARQEKR